MDICGITKHVFFNLKQLDCLKIILGITNLPKIWGCVLFHQAFVQ